VGLLLTGLALFVPFLHVTLIRYLNIIYAAHIFLGLLFFLSLFSPIMKKLPKVNRIRIVDWFMPISFGIAIVLTGFPLWQINWFPAALREQAFAWHGNLSYLLGTWFVLHGLFKASGTKYPEIKVTKKMDPDRRQFLHWGGAGTDSVFAALLLTRKAIEYRSCCEYRCTRLP
jgi:hypothetical protein